MEKIPDAPVRRSARLEAKPKMPAVDKAINVLHLKLGLKTSEEIPIVTARKQYLELYKDQLPDDAVGVINHLLKLKMPCFADVDSALTNMAGPGGVEFIPMLEEEAHA